MDNKIKMETEKNTAKEAEQIEKSGELLLDHNKDNHKIHLVSIIGEIEGHEVLSPNTKTTKYEHVLPRLAEIEDNKDIQGVMVILNTVGGDVESGLAIAEMIASLSIPTVSLVLGGSHSIGAPLAVATDYSFIVPSGTMVVHPVRMNGTILGAPQTFDYFKQMQDRIVTFIEEHSLIQRGRFEKLMMETGVMTRDMGTILVGREAVAEGIINEVGGIAEAFKKLHQMIEMENGNKI
ncbi:MAG: ATP-dependent Clp protease proteolytic subunit [Lachnospiraceae bacterium]